MGQLGRPLMVVGIEVRCNRFLRSATMESRAGAHGQVRRELLRLYHDLAVGGMRAQHPPGTRGHRRRPAWSQQLGAWTIPRWSLSFPAWPG